MAEPKSNRKNTLFVIIFALLIDLLAFTIILPLFPRLLKHYEIHERKDSLYKFVNGLITKFRKTISLDQDRLDIILFGGLVGSLFSFLQFLSAPIIGMLSDKYGRRTVLLCSMIGNALSMTLWIFAEKFEIFLASRIVGGLTEGNVQMSIAMISDISTESNRSRALALVGIAFSVGFTIGPPMGAYLASIDLKSYFPKLPINSFSSPALFALILILIETTYMWIYLPETLNRKGLEGVETDLDTPDRQGLEKMKEEKNLVLSLPFLSFVHFIFLFVFSGMEFTLTFLTYDRFGFSNVDQGLLLSFMGVLTAMIQGGWVRRKGVNRESSLILQGIFSCSIGLFILGYLAVEPNEKWLLYVGAAFFAVTNGTVVTCLTALASFSGSLDESQPASPYSRGQVLGVFRSIGQLGRCIGPLSACSAYWILGSVKAYLLASSIMGLLGIFLLVIFTKAAKKKIKKE